TLSVSNSRDSVVEKNMTVTEDVDRTLSIEHNSINVLKEDIIETLINSTNGIKGNEKSETDEDVLEKPFFEIKDNFPIKHLENEKIIPGKLQLMIQTRKKIKVKKNQDKKTKIEKKARREELIPEVSENEQEFQEESKNSTQMGKTRTTKKRTNITINLLRKINLNQITEDKKLLRKNEFGTIKRKWKKKD
ncbi:hypothetical protein SNEBB_006563, partial [Seison nebaliae]